MKESMNMMTDQMKANKRILNVVFSTTRQYNVGDEFILRGILNIFENTAFCCDGGGINPIIFNRNPDIRKGGRLDNPLKKKAITNRRFHGKGLLRSFLDMDFYDNSIRDDSDWSNIDLIVFAGTPEWYGRRSAVLYKKSREYNIPMLFLGIGVGEEGIEHKLKAFELASLKNAECITVRDVKAEKLLRKYGARLLTCPSIICGKKSKLVERVKRIGLIYSCSKVSENNNITESTYQYMKKMYRLLIKKYGNSQNSQECRYVFELICHYVEELDYVNVDFPGVRYRYSYDSGQYEEIYLNYDLVIGCRVHGIAIAASLGIPGISMAHSIRSDTVRHLGAELIDMNKNNVDSALCIIEEAINSVSERSVKLREIREKACLEYTAILDGVLERF